MKKRTCGTIGAAFLLCVGFIFAGCFGNKQDTPAVITDPGPDTSPPVPTPFADLSMKASPKCDDSVMRDASVLACFKPQQEAQANKTVAVISISKGGSGGAFENPTPQVDPQVTNVTSGPFLVVYGDYSKVRFLIWSHPEINWGQKKADLEAAVAAHPGDESAARAVLDTFPQAPSCPAGFKETGRFMPKVGFDARVRGERGGVLKFAGTPATKGGWITACVLDESQTGLYISSIEDEMGNTQSGLGEGCPSGTQEVGRFKPDSRKDMRATGYSPNGIAYDCNPNATDPKYTWDPRVSGPCPTALVEGVPFFAGWISICDEISAPQAQNAPPCAPAISASAIPSTNGTCAANLSLGCCLKNNNAWSSAFGAACKSNVTAQQKLYYCIGAVSEDSASPGVGGGT